MDKKWENVETPFGKVQLKNNVNSYVFDITTAGFDGVLVVPEKALDSFDLNSSVIDAVKQIGSAFSVDDDAYYAFNDASLFLLNKNLTNDYYKYLLENCGYENTFDDCVLHMINSIRENHPEHIAKFAPIIEKNFPDVYKQSLSEPFRFQGLSDYLATGRNENSFGVIDKYMKDWEADSGLNADQIIKRVMEAPLGFCKDMGIPGPLRNFSDYMYSEGNKKHKVSVLLSKNKFGFSSEDMYIKEAGTGLVCVDRGHNTETLASLDTTDYFFKGEHIGHIVHKTDKEPPMVTVYGESKLALMFEEYVKDICKIDFVLMHEAESPRKYKGYKKEIVAFKNKYGNKSKEIAR